jgi:acetyl esterase/lipase
MSIRIAASLLIVSCFGNGDLQGQDRSADDVRAASAQFFARHDTNGDQKLSKDELPGRLQGRFARLDDNGDGFITPAEELAFRLRASTNPARKVPAGVKAHRDVEYARAGEMKLLLDVYVPEGPTMPLPLIVWIHGGAWRGGSKQSCPPLPLTKEGFVTASISYRLSQEAIWPAQIHDCKAAIRWLRAHADEFNIDTKRVGVWGSSAGGHLVAMLGTSGDVAELEGESGNLDQSSRVQAVCDFFGPTDFLLMQRDSLPNGPIDHDAEDSPESQLIGGPIQDNPRKVASANPITYVTPDDPPCLIVHGSRDPLVPWQQSKYLHQAFVAAGLKHVTFHLVDGAGHGFGGREDINEMVETFFKKHLGADSSE